MSSRDHYIGRAQFVSAVDNQYRSSRAQSLSGSLDHRPRRTALRHHESCPTAIVRKLLSWKISGDASLFAAAAFTSRMTTSWSPARIDEEISQSSCAAASDSRTASDSVANHGIPANRSTFLAAICRHAASCLDVRTETPRCRPSASCGHVVDVCCTQIDTNAGSMDTGVNEVATIPTGCPSRSAHTAATPVG